MLSTNWKYWLCISLLCSCYLQGERELTSQLMCLFSYISLSTTQLLLAFCNCFCLWFHQQRLEAVAFCFWNTGKELWKSDSWAVKGVSLECGCAEFCSPAYQHWGLDLEWESSPQAFKCTYFFVFVMCRAPKIPGPGQGSFLSTSKGIYISLCAELNSAELNSKFSWAHTKSEAVPVNVLAPAEEEVHRVKWYVLYLCHQLPQVKN